MKLVMVEEEDSKDIPDEQPYSGAATRLAWRPFPPAEGFQSRSASTSSSFHASNPRWRIGSTARNEKSSKKGKQSYHERIILAFFWPKAHTQQGRWGRLEPWSELSEHGGDRTSLIHCGKCKLSTFGPKFPLPLDRGGLSAQLLSTSLALFI